MQNRAYVCLCRAVSYAQGATSSDLNKQSVTSLRGIDEYSFCSADGNLINLYAICGAYDVGQKSI